MSETVPTGTERLNESCSFQLLKLWENHGYLNKETLEVRSELFLSQYFLVFILAVFFSMSGY